MTQTRPCFRSDNSQQRSPPLARLRQEATARSGLVSPKLEERRRKGGDRGGVVSTNTIALCGDSTPRQHKLRLSKKAKPKFLHPPPQGGRNAFLVIALTILATLPAF